MGQDRGKGGGGGRKRGAKQECGAQPTWGSESFKAERKPL